MTLRRSFAERGFRPTAEAAWVRGWMRFGRPRGLGRVAYAMAGMTWPHGEERGRLAELDTEGFVAWSAHIGGARLHRGEHVFIGDRVVISCGDEGGPVALGDHARLYSDVRLSSGRGGSITIGSRTNLHEGAVLTSVLSPIEIGDNVEISSGCAMFSYDHASDPRGLPVKALPLTSAGPIVVGDGAWIGYGAILLSGVRVGPGAVVGAGSVVTRDVPADAIAVGNPARVVRHRSEQRFSHERPPNRRSSSDSQRFGASPPIAGAPGS